MWKPIEINLTLKFEKIFKLLTINLIIYISILSRFYGVGKSLHKKLQMLHKFNLSKFILFLNFQ